MNHSAQAELTASVDNVDDPYNNALAEIVNGFYKAKLLYLPISHRS